MGIGIPILILSMLASTAAAQERQQPAFILRLPDGIAAETATIFYSADGEGGYKSAGIPTRRGTFDYPILPLPFPFNVPTPSQSDPSDRTGELPSFLKEFKTKSDEPQNLKLLIYVPGYRIVAATFDTRQLVPPQIFTPDLVPLASARFEGRLVDSKRQPLSNQMLSLSYPFEEECTYFGMADCILPEIPIATFATKNDGTFSVKVPALAEDPFFNTNGKFVLKTGVAPVRSTDWYNHFFSPSEFRTVEISQYAVVTDIAPGILSGPIGKDFFALNGLDSVVRLLPPLEYRDRLNVRIDAADSNGGSVRSDLLKSGGTFELKLPPGEYDLSIVVEDRRVPVRSGIIVREGQRQVLEMP